MAFQVTSLSVTTILRMPASTYKYLPSEGKKSSSHLRSSRERKPVFFLNSRSVSTRNSSDSFSISTTLWVCLAVFSESP